MKSDDTLWPLCLFELEGPQSIGTHEEMLATWDQWFARKEPFVALRIYRDAASLEQVRGVAKATKAWMKAGGAQNIRTHVSAMIIVVPPGSLVTLGKMDVARAFGVPGGIFEAVDDVVIWLQRQGADGLQLPQDLKPSINLFIQSRTQNS